MNPKLITFIVFVFVIQLKSIAQNQANIWYFGDGAGLTFNEGEPTPLGNGRITITSNTGENEGSSVISDHEGNLLFYSDGETVWNTQHEVMPNGTGLLGHSSSTHAAFIVPLPLSSRFFYLFTTDSFHHTRLENGLRFSVIDMCREDGLGDVMPGQKNILLQDLIAEKIAVARHSNGVDYWIVTHKYNSADFLAYRLTPDGLDLDNVVISTVGAVHEVPDYPESLSAALGQMKISPNGQKLSICAANLAPGILELFDFNTQTGIVSNPISLTETIENALNQSAGFTYGTEFSPDNSKLYFTNSRGVSQFDLSSNNNVDILNSFSQVASNQPYRFSPGMQMAPNGKIYISNYGDFVLSSIENPNEKGAACNFVDAGQALGGHTASYSLPSFIAGFDYSNSELGECEEPDCSGEPGGTRIIDECGDCLQPGAENFNESCADCTGTPNGDFVVDNCDKCLLPSDPDFNQTCVDCAGITGGDRIIDECGECISRNDPNINQTCMDCAGVPNGDYQIDQCEECLSPSDPEFGQSCLDCMGIVNGLHYLDYCGNCLHYSDYNFDYSCTDCIFEVEGFLFDDCGECKHVDDPEFNLSCADCAGIPNGNFVLDECGECLAPDDPNFNLSCVDCAGISGGNNLLDECGVCLPPDDVNFNQSCADCTGTPNGNFVLDNCGECLSPSDPNFNLSCVDCAGISGGNNLLDECGVCLPPDDVNFDQSCADCAGIPNGNFVLDECGECLSPSDPNFNLSCLDCAGISGGNNQLDECGECLPSNDPNFNQSCADCTGTPNGDFVLDECGECLRTSDPQFNLSCLTAKIFIPNAFSPNEDGINDLFQVLSNGTLPVQIINYVIYNRYTQKVYAAKNFDINDNSFWWDGMYKNKKQPLGVYIYYIEAEILNEPVQKFKGNVTLVR